MKSLKLKNCLQCGQLFQSHGSDLCPTCTQVNKTDFEAVKEYLRTHHGATVEETIRETGIEASRLLTWLREGHLWLKP